MVLEGFDVTCLKIIFKQFIYLCIALLKTKEGGSALSGHMMLVRDSGIGNLARKNTKLDGIDISWHIKPIQV